jgi:type II secretory pathway pseudopilin PulG
MSAGRDAGGFKKANPPLGKQSGFTYIGLLIFVAIAGAGLAAFGQIASHAAQREKEAELLFRGNAIEAAIASYYKKENRYPASLEALLEDKRYPMPVRHLRKLYPDPMTGEANWALVEAPGGGVMGVHSRADAAPIKTGNFPLKNEAFAEARTYADWKFIHSPPGLGRGLEKSASK